MKKKNKRVLVGRWLLILGLGALLFFVSPYLYLEGKYYLSQIVRKKEAEVSGFGKILKSIEEESGFAAIIRESDLMLLNPVDPEFSVVIPKISVNSAVFANIPVDDEDVWGPVLQKGVAHAKGSYFPDQEGTVYLFGHSTDYIWNVNRFNAVFYLLKEMEAGDRVAVFYKEDRYEYEVTENKIVKTDQLEEINRDFATSRLILQTCWPPGTTWKRLLVFAKPV